VDSLDVAGAWQ